MAQRIADICGGVAGKTLAILGLTFKPNTDDLREAPSLTIIPELIARGARIRAYDPEGLAEAQQQLPGIQCCDSAYEASTGADAAVILTEWNEFRALDLSRLKALMRRPTLIDLRNIYDPRELSRAGFAYHCVGRPYIPPAV
jgi:UDPglucose 6-dehydrogenase